MKWTKFQLIIITLLFSTLFLACQGNKTDGNDSDQQSADASTSEGDQIDPRLIVGYTVNQDILNQILTSIMIGMNEVSLSTVSEEAQAQWENVKAICGACSPEDFQTAFNNEFQEAFALNRQANANMIEVGLSPNLFSYEDQADFSTLLNDAIDYLGRNRNQATYTLYKFLQRDESRRGAVIEFVENDFVWDASTMFEPIYEEITLEEEELPSPPDTFTTVDTVPEIANTITLDLSPVSTAFALDALIGQVNYTSDTNFVLLDRSYTDARNHYLHKDAAEAFILMANDAASSDIELVAKSCARNFSKQLSIWDNKWQREDFMEFEAGPERCLAILQYSSMPGTSRHHWGTEIDIHSFNNESFEQGPGKAIYDWLTLHAADYGFFQPYTAGRDKGYEEEKWHWSYYPISGPMLEQYNTQVNYTMINGFSGSEFASSIGIIENYVNGIAPLPVP